MPKGKVGTTPFTRATKEINRELREHGHTHHIRGAEARSVFQKWKGRCVFCGIPLLVRARTTGAALGFQFYTPLSCGGRPTIDNVVPTCTGCRKFYRTTRQPREELFNVNTFADLTEQLILELQQHKQHKGRITRIKRMMNQSLEDMVNNMRYKTYPDQAPEEFELLVEDKNTLPEEIEGLTKALKEDNKPSVDKEKDRVTDRVKQIITSKQYKVIVNE